MFGGISVWQLLILLAIVVVIFGTKRLRNIGGDLGGAIKGFRKGMAEDEDKKPSEQLDADDKAASQQSVHESTVADAQKDK